MSHGCFGLMDFLDEIDDPDAETDGCPVGDAFTVHGRVPDPGCADHDATAQGFGKYLNGVITS
jgi:hypothetical protein